MKGVQVAWWVTLALLITAAFPNKVAAQSSCSVENFSARDLLVVIIDGPQPGPFCLEWLGGPDFAPSSRDAQTAPAMLCSFRIGDYTHSVYYTDAFDRFYMATPVCEAIARRQFDYYDQFK